MKTFRGGGKSKTMIPDSRMLHPKNRYDKRVDNKKCNIQGDKEWFRCYWCFKGPFAKLKGAHYNNCNCHGLANKANHEAAKKRHASTKSYTQMNVSSMIRVTAPPAKRQKASTSSSSSSRVYVGGRCDDTISVNELKKLKVQNQEIDAIGKRKVD